LETIPAGVTGKALATVIPPFGWSIFGLWVIFGNDRISFHTDAEAF
jgi:hypothetical protein